MTTALRLSTIALCFLAVVACSKKEEKGKSTAPVAESATSFSQSNSDAEVVLSFPDTIKAFPELHVKLYTEGEADLKDFATQAAKDHAELKAAGSEPLPYFRSIKWTLPAQSEHLVSVYADMQDFTGGAHPNTNYQAILWDKDTQQALDTRTLFAQGANLSDADTYLCRQIEAERSKRAETPTTQAATGFTCPKLIDSRIALVPSTTAGKIGALEVLFAPYDVGPYAEGPYQIRIPQAVIRALINPAYAADFAGDPVAVTADPAG
ncbi:DUF4163 domain-containing protein [Asticcacaulis sp. BYS171W]|uniref:DUF4163 domain-containing protein n=1 Tax=Asticcacaulis aquaticus TaxID=2984212 RepID=A0ABT5HTY3_9CAUL|nr:DUF3298 and DUF4163 domain-containing protein [Asticcacaulis aquaticus]MDC7683408.1 DUF4163 domain-containing protein [Asticcacaulis aquaticus]